MVTWTELGFSEEDANIESLKYWTHLRSETKSWAAGMNDDGTLRIEEITE